MLRTLGKPMPHLFGEWPTQRLAVLIGLYGPCNALEYDGYAG